MATEVCAAAEDGVAVQTLRHGLHRDRTCGGPTRLRYPTAARRRFTSP